MHSFTLILSFIFFSLSVPRGLGVSCNLSIGFSLAYPGTCSPSQTFLFLSDHFPCCFHVSPWVITCLSLSFCVSPSLSLLSLLGFLRILSVCLQHVCDRAAWQEGRQADGHWDLEWLRSGASGAHGEHVFPTSVECQRTPIHCLSPQHSSLKGPFRPKSILHATAGLFCCELKTSGDISCGDVCLLLNILQQS